MALIQELSDTISYSYKLKDGIFSLSKCLLLFNLNELCVELQNKYEELVDLIEKYTNDIWNYPSNNETEQSTRVYYGIQSGLSTAVPTDFSKLGKIELFNMNITYLLKINKE